MTISFSAGHQPVGTTEPDPTTFDGPSLRERILREVERALNEGSNPHREVLPAIYPLLTQEFGVDAVLAYLVDGDAMKLAFVEGFDEDSVQLLQRLDFGQAICGTVAASRKPMHVADVQRSLDPRADLVRAVGIAAYASEPVLAGDALLGTLSFGSRRRRAFTIEEQLFFRAIARLFAHYLQPKVA